jgi:hypothetical protein
MASDPNGWATSPPSVLVKIKDTSRDVINGQTGIVLQYAADRARYTVQMAVSQDIVSLKPSNLTKCNLMEQMTGQYQFLVHNPQIKQEIVKQYTRVQNVLPAYIKPEYLVVPVLLIVAGLFYMLGFTRTFMLFSFVLLVGMIVGPDVVAPNSTVRTVASNAPNRFREVLRQQVPVVGNRIADSKYMSAAAAGLFLFFFVNAMTVSNNGKRASGGGGGSMSSPPTRMTATSQHPPEYYYKLGFDDAVAENPFGMSLPKPEPAAVPPPALSDEWRIHDDDEFTASSASSNAHTAESSQKSASPWYTKMGTAMSFYYIYNTIQTLGQDPVSGSWNWQLCLAAAKTMEPWKMGMLGLSIYKVVSTLIFGK